MNKNIPLLLILVFLLFSCQTKGKPRWITNPPEDDSLNIYIVGHGMSSDMDTEVMKEAAFKSVLSELYRRFSIPEDIFLDKVITGMLKDSFKEITYSTDEKVAVIDRWSNDRELYILVRIRKSFFNPLLEAYTERYDEMMSYYNEAETDGDASVSDGNMYKAYQQYIKALESMLMEDDGFYIVPILRVLDKILNIFKNMHYSEAETFSTIYIGEAYYSKGESKPTKRFYFEVLGEEGQDFSGFAFKLFFKEGWKNRDKSSLVKLINNSMEFIPPRPKLTGAYTVKSELYLDDIINRLEPWAEEYFISGFLSSLAELIKSSEITFVYNAESDLGIRSKLVAFNNRFINEGVIRYLLEIEDFSESVPYFIDDESLLSYVREINLLTENRFLYLILGDSVEISTQDYEDRVMFKLSAEFSIIDLNNSNVVLSRKVQSEFIGVPGEEDLAYLDLGLKIGDVVSQIKF